MGFTIKKMNDSSDLSRTMQGMEMLLGDKGMSVAT